MSRSVDTLKALMPRGRAWTRAVGQRLTKTLTAVAREFDRLEARAADLLRESVPTDADELLEDWESVSKADTCTSGASQAVRRGAVVARLNPASPTEGVLRAAIEALGYSPEFNYWQPFVVGRSAVGEPLSNDEWQHTVGVTVSSAGADDDAALECTVASLLHLHVFALFTYGTPGGLYIVTEAGDRITTEAGDPLITD